MNDDLTVGTVTIDNGDLKIMTSNGLSTIGSGVTGSVTAVNTYGALASGVNISAGFDVDDFLDEHVMNRITVDHKVSEQELMKLREVAPDYADEIKENIAKNLARDVAKKTTYTKKHDKNADVHHFIGRVWVFTEEELKKLIMETRNA